MFTFSTSAQTQAWAEKFVAQLQRPCVVLLDGDVGAGKTQLVRWFCGALGVRGAMSPTFSIHQRYSGQGGAIDHADFYRLKDLADLESSGFWDLLLEPKGLLFVEWADRVKPDAWPRHWLRVHIQLFKGTDGEESRRVQLAVMPPST